MADTYDIDKITPEMMKAMIREEGIHPAQVSGLSAATQRKMPYTAAGLPGLNIGEVGMGRNAGIGGFTVPDRQNPGKSAVVMNADTPNYKQTLKHELEHALELQGGHRIHEEWDNMVKGSKGGDRYDVVKRLVEHAPYLQSKWGLDPESAYFSREEMDYQGRLANNLLREQLASLSAIEQARNKRLTDDPYVRENIFTTPEQRAAYNAVTGLRQTRLDPRDLPAYKMQEDKSDPGYTANPKSTMEKLKSALGFANGGMVVKPFEGNSKII